MKSGIYAITNTVNGKVYIGSTIDFDVRWNIHRNDLQRGNHYNVYLQRSWNKYGESVFAFGVLEYLDNFEELLLAEQFWVEVYREEGKKLYNIGKYVDNPMRGRHHTEEAKQKLRDSNLGKKHSEETKCRMGESHKGKVRSEEHCHNLSISTKRAWASGAYDSEETRRRMSDANKGKPNPLRGRKHTEEHRHKNSEAHKGKPSGMLGKHHSEESRRKNSESHKGKKHSKETRQKQSEAHKGRKYGPMSEEAKQKLRETNLGKKHSEETKRKMSESQKARWAKIRENR